VAGFPPERPVYLLGESFGGILALAVAANRPDLVDRVVLVNPATSYQQSIWPTLGPLLPRVPKANPLVILFAARNHVQLSEFVGQLYCRCFQGEAGVLSMPLVNC
jgi:pimeloyl-ACP methyl ester carboxylesterase